MHPKTKNDQLQTERSSSQHFGCTLNNLERGGTYSLIRQWGGGVSRKAHCSNTQKQKQVCIVHERHSLRFVMKGQREGTRGELQLAIHL